MPHYHFVARTENSQTENIGVMELRHEAGSANARAVCSSCLFRAGQELA
jgi:hypothetical protein